MRTLRGRAVALFMTVAAITAAGSVSVPAAHAASWDPRVEPIAREVEKLRGLEFKHPVPVDFLSDAAFSKSVAVTRDTMPADDKAELIRAQFQLRSIGLLRDDVDLIDAISSLQTSGTLAKYEPKTERATVRGKKIDAATKVTLAHELTHALQDQHFDLTKLLKAATRSHSSGALRALVEGDARRVQLLYADQLSDAERRQNESFQTSGADQALAETRAGNVPDSLSVLFQSPYTLGPSMLDVAQAAEGKRAIDGLFRNPPRADTAYLTPWTLVDDSKVTKVAPPELAADETAEGKPDVFGSFVLYLTLAARSDPVAALGVVDGWGGDAMVTFKRGDTTCIRTTFVGRTQKDTTAIGDALRQWSAAGPAGAASVEDGAAGPTLTACDPGAANVATTMDGSIAALTVAALRNQILGSLAQQGAGIDAARCTANGVIVDPTFRPLLDAAADNPNVQPPAAALAAFQQNVLATAARCAR